MDGFEKRTLKKRKAILDTSLSLFNKYGYKNVTIAQISKQTPVSLETIYNYFGSKDN
ncbi:TetR/AcrR family transcriptional regulator [Clostridium sp. AWRP]|uniref:TetR/AcrR family transcriptional regulator n=1 Tax=Clostridium sp. AWRP TaxID=2212991 RepID=UPI0015869898|nr:TetR/AcrR family transcriptional regulator [Clostridium sp. AWRP]